jgi:hypothetical protein
MRVLVPLCAATLLATPAAAQVLAPEPQTERPELRRAAACTPAGVLHPGAREWRQAIRALAAGTGNVIVLDVDSPRERQALAAEIASALDRRLLRAEVDDVAGRSIGETEKNLVRVFSMDRDAGTVVFLDGVRGRRPPRAAPSDVPSYRYGGGAVGSVLDVLRDEQLVILGASPDAETLAAWGPRVRAVIRPQATEGGRDAEAPEGVAARAPLRIGAARGFTVCVPGR